MKIGIALYNIELNECLNGVYTNDGLKGEIFNEIARLRIGTKLGEDGISGEYDCFYFDIKNKRENGTLIIKVISANKRINSYEYEFLWKDEKGRDIFIGTGYKMNEKQLVAHYKYVGK